MISVEAVPGASAARAEYMERLMSRLDQTVVPTDGPTDGAITGSFPLPLTALTQRQGIHTALRSCRFAVEDNTKRGGFWIRSETKTLQQISATISSRLRQVQIEQY